MSYLPDLTQSGPQKTVGYLSFGHAYPRGKISDSVFERLVALVEEPMWLTCGYHQCNLGWCNLSRLWSGSCLPHKFRFRGRVFFLGSYDIWVPGDKVLYVAPNLILHYIRHHRYRPPQCFCEAVLNSPRPGSVEYRATIKQIDLRFFDSG
jgi:hypothetical protein